MNITRVNHLVKVGLVFLALSVAFTGCKKDDDDDVSSAGGGGSTTPVETTVDEDKAHITSTFNEVVMCTEEIQSGKIVSLVKTIFDVNQGNSTDPDWLEAIIDSLPGVFDFELIDTTLAFDIDEHMGIYAYDKTTLEWTFTNTADGTLTVQFPSTDGGDNDLELYVSGYADEAHTFDGDDIRLPTSFKLEFTQNGSTLVKLELVAAQYQQLDNIVIPIYIDIDIILDPLTIDVIARRVSSMKFDVSMSVTNGGSCGASFYAAVVLDHDDYENLVEDDIVSMEGTLIYNNLKITSNLDYAALHELEEPTIAEINANTDVDVYYNNVVIGQLQVMDVDGEEEIHMVYKDATTENVEDAYLIPLLDDLEIALFDLVGEW
ncbi:MAG: hypothetical protein HRT71_16930 [Flavobacteriales bacterium]|nr:hypothetical protein [Flavobacteriales bacterium]